MTGSENSEKFSQNCFVYSYADHKIVNFKIEDILISYAKLITEEHIKTSIWLGSTRSQDPTVFLFFKDSSELRIKPVIILSFISQ